MATYRVYPSTPHYGVVDIEAETVLEQSHQVRFQKDNKTVAAFERDCILGWVQRG